MTLYARNVAGIQYENYLCVVLIHLVQVLCKHYTKIKSYMRVILSFVDESVGKTSSTKQNHYFDALEPYMHDDINDIEQV